MPTTYEQIRCAVLNGSLHPTDLAKQVVLLTPTERTGLENLLLVQARLIQEVLQLFSVPPSSSQAQPIESGVLPNEVGELRLGDVVRSNDENWLNTGQHLTGSIVRFEPVPESQVPSCWQPLLGVPQFG